LVIVWVRDVWDALLFIVSSFTGKRPLVIYHNPRQVRPRAGVRAYFERLLLRRSTVLVHSDWLARLAAEDFLDIRVVEHPPYDLLLRSAPGSKEVEVSTGGYRQTRVAWIGGLREDKGVGDLPAIAAASGGGWTLCYLGSDAISETLRDKLKACGVEVESPAGGSELPGDELVARLKTCALAIAPYRGVTESGSVRLAMAVGVGVLGYDSPGLRRLLNDRSLFKDPREFGLGLSEFIRSPWLTFRYSADEARAAAKRSWNEVALNG
jgi:glycosyltransferase involved in cell wall biosynthesis